VAASEAVTATEEMTATEEVSTTEGVPAEVEEAMESGFSVDAAVDEFFSNIPEGYQAVGDIDVFKDMMENGNIYLVDVRTPDEYAEGHIPGAVNAPLRTIADNLDKIPTDQSVMVYCSSGHRAAMSLASLDMLGYTNVKSFPPGWKGWTAAEEEVSTDAVEPGEFDMPEVQPEMLAAVAEFLTNIPEGYYTIGTAEKLQGAIDAGAELIDVRQPEEYAEGAIEDAINIPIRELGKHLDEIPTDQQVVVYCGSGHRAAMSLAGLQVAGLTNVRSFPPSYKGWVAANE
jgi:rhodanese-related sulfurtransferase